MSTTLYVKSAQNSSTILHLIKSTIDNEIVKLELAVKIADKHLKPFEEKYQISSDYFISHLAAEDLEGGDDEYVRWAGEYQLKQRLLQKLEQLREIEYDHSGVLQSH
jgi:hypothetical protein